MRWSNVLKLGLAGAIVLYLVNFVLHGVILAATYAKYPDVFQQDEMHLVGFAVVTLLTTLILAWIFDRTRGSWGAGLMGGANFGFCAGLFLGVQAFYDAFVFAGFPEFLAWCNFGCEVISITAVGAVMGILLKE